MNNLNPAWKTFKVSVNSLCSGDQDRRLKVRSNSYFFNSFSHRKVGLCFSTVDCYSVLPSSLMEKMITQLHYDYHNQIKDAEKWYSTVISRLCSIFLTVTSKNDGAVFSQSVG